MKFINKKLNEREASFGLVLGCILFGLGSVIVAKISLGAYSVAFWRLFIAGIIFFIIMKLRYKSLPSSKKAIFLALLSGVFLAYDLALWHESIYAIGPGISTLLNSLQIFWLTFIGVIILKERLSKFSVFALFLAFFGITLIALPEFKTNINASWGFISGIVSGIFLSLSMLCIKKIGEHEKTNIFSLMFLLSFGGAISLLPIAIAIDSHRFFPQNFTEISLVFIYGSVMQCIAWGLIAYSVPLISLSLTGILLLSEPIAALFIDAFLLAKLISLAQWIGAGITMFAIYLGVLKR
ncbi:DMT family transporter [Campylobacter sp. faydin G-105]|uniref:DMT family transporter n=1 Tax=Campylobacter anatolicus TaxID=2829105 RepID=UPI001BA1566F|nr:DMT family transporter [Campylobacter anatolicus]MBR8462211.1 DMT family transporter [Campylobacter anatolicus]